MRSEGSRILYVLGRRGHVLVQALSAANVPIYPPSLKLRNRTRLTAAADLFRQLAKGPARRHWDLVLADSVENAPLAWAVSELFDLPLIVRVRGDAWREVEQAGKRGLAMRFPGVRSALKLFNAILRRAARVVPTSSYLGIQIQVRADVPSWRIVPVPISVDVKMFCRRTTDEARLLLGWGRDPVVFSVTNFRFPEKFAGLERLLPWMRSAMERHPTLRWIVAGAGPGLPGFRRRAAAALGGSAGRLETPGYIQDLATHYQACNAVIHFTDLDAFPRAVLEAQACGRVVLANPLGGVPEMIADQVSGFLFEPGELFLEILRRVLADPEIEKIVGENARNSVVQRFSPERVGELWRRVFALVGQDSAAA